MSHKVVTRFAPSPTGFMHVGNLRTALFAWLWARKNKGVFILRIEDTDKEREVPGAVGHIMETLNWLGLDWNEGPYGAGSQESYYQSQRLEIYRKYAEKLLTRGLAYLDSYSEEELEELRRKAELDNKLFLFREHRPDFARASLSKPNQDKNWYGVKPLRFKVPEIKSYHWQDLVYGNLSAGPEALDDFVLIKSDGFPTYNFAHIVDDIEMGITHVIRGQEFISSIPKFLSLYEALGENPPFLACLPHILSADGAKKLGKRDKAKDALAYREEGYLPEAMLNYLALLGWHPASEQGLALGRPEEKEIFNVEELIEAFDLNRIQKAGARWDDDKLDWINKEHLKKLSPERLKGEIFKWLPEDMRNPKIVPLIAERINKFKDVKKMLSAGELYFFFITPDYPKEKLIYQNASPEKISENLKKVIFSLQSLGEKDFTKEKIKEILMAEADELNSRGEILHPVRFALSGLDKSPDPFLIAEILGKDETLRRLQKAI